MSIRHSRSLLASVVVLPAPALNDMVSIDHHLSNGRFQNPWPSFTFSFGPSTMGRVVWDAMTQYPKIPPKEELPQIVRPNFSSEKAPNELRATWLGHACFLVEFPSRADGQRGPRLLFDPVFSERCSPSQYYGPKRYTPAPISMDDIPDIDAVVLSHNHYDHLDLPTLRHIYASQKGSLHFFAPLGNKVFLEKQLGASDSEVTELDWWHSALLSVTVGSEEHYLRLIATPAQHMTARGLFDRFKTLWASWAVLELDSADVPSARVRSRYWFSGDTGYKSVSRGATTEEGLPTNPVFKQIGKAIGPFDLASVPIGAYSPRWAMSPIHANPADAVKIHGDVQSKKSIAMHWGTWILTTENILEPPEKLGEALKEAGLSADDISVIAIGGEVVVQV